MSLYDITQGKVNVRHSVWFCVCTACKTKMYSRQLIKTLNLLTPYILYITDRFVIPPTA
jgi:hypothetical protein